MSGKRVDIPTAEVKGPYSVRRDEHGYACAIDREGYTVLHLMAGTERNEQEVQGIVDRLNQETGGTTE